jgi:hypothetical protein
MDKCCFIFVHQRPLRSNMFLRPFAESCVFSSRLWPVPLTFFAPEKKSICTRLFIRRDPHLLRPTPGFPAVIQRLPRVTPPLLSGAPPVVMRIGMRIAHFLWHIPGIRKTKRTEKKGLKCLNLDQIALNELGHGAAVPLQASNS